jgi:hypothetical protein
MVRMGSPVAEYKAAELLQAEAAGIRGND